MSSDVSTITTNEIPGLLVSSLLRRDADKADDDYDYILNMIWADRDSYMKHAQTDTVQKLTAAGNPTPVFYEGKLTLINCDEFQLNNVNSVMSAGKVDGGKFVMQ